MNSAAIEIRCATEEFRQSLGTVAAISGGLHCTVHLEGHHPLKGL